MRRTAPALLLALLAATLPGCSSAPPANPAKVVADDTRPTGSRMRAMQTLADELAQTPPAAEGRGELRERFKTVAWGRRDILKLRYAAIEHLLDDDPADTQKMLALMVPTERSVEMLRFISHLAITNGWTDHTAPFIRSWARPSIGARTDDRPEPRTIEGLHPGTPVAEVVFDVFITPVPDRAFGEKERRAAWEVLGILDPTGAETSERIAALPDTDDPLISAVQESARALGAVPVTKEQLEWLTLMRDPEHAAFWNRATGLIARATPEQREGLALRHAAAFIDTETHRPELLRSSREEALSTLRAQIGGRPYHHRTSEGSKAALSESLATAAPDLSWGDTVHLIGIDAALQDEHTRRLLFAHADRDRADTSTEHGGVLTTTDETGPGAYAPVLYPPRPTHRRGDKSFIAPAEMFTQHPGALAHFHFHVQDTKNARYAGPGPVDKEYANIFGRACVVLTSVDEDTLAMDYYLPGGVTVDFGTITRPADPAP